MAAATGWEAAAGGNRVERATHRAGNAAGRAEIRAGHGPALPPTHSTPFGRSGSP